MGRKSRSKRALTLFELILVCILISLTFIASAFAIGFMQESRRCSASENLACAFESQFFLWYNENGKVEIQNVQSGSESVATLINNYNVAWGLSSGITLDSADSSGNVYIFKTNILDSWKHQMLVYVDSSTDTLLVVCLGGSNKFQISDGGTNVLSTLQKAVTLYKNGSNVNTNGNLICAWNLGSVTEDYKVYGDKYAFS